MIYLLLILDDNRNRYPTNAINGGWQIRARRRTLSMEVSRLGLEDEQKLREERAPPRENQVAKQTSRRWVRNTTLR